MNTVDGIYRAVQVETGDCLDFLLQEHREGDARCVSGVLRWGDVTEQAGEVRGEVLGGVVWMEIVPAVGGCWPATPDDEPLPGFAAFLDLASLSGTIVGSGHVAEHLQQVGAFTVIERLELAARARPVPRSSR